MRPLGRNLCYAQSGGVTAVINATASSVIRTARDSKKIDNILCGKNGILGVLSEELIDTKKESSASLLALRYTPGGAFGSCRHKLPAPIDDERPYQRIANVFRAHDIGYFLYNGGNDSQDTTLKIAKTSARLGWPVVCVGIPKTIDNDLAITDTCPGFGSVAKYVATTVAETTLDIASMARTSTKVFIIEVMGRNAGWIAASGGLSGEPQGPHLIIFPEVPFATTRFLRAVREKVRKHGYCVVIVSEGARRKNGCLLSERSEKDMFAHSQLGGVAPILAEMIKKKLGYKYHWAVADYMQRSARHIASATDVKQAECLGEEAVKMALNGDNAMMPAIRRLSDKPYRWRVEKVPLSKVANRERIVPKNYVTKDGFFITEKCRRYLTPLIMGEDHPPFKNGLPVHARMRGKLVKPKLKTSWNP